MAENRYRDIQKLYHAGQALVRRQKYDQAIAKFKRITGSDLQTLALPGAVDAARDNREAEEAALRPFYVKAHVSLAVCYTEKGMFQEAISVLRRASQIDPQNADALCALGYVYRRNGMIDAAIEAFQKALECDPRCARAQKSLAFLAMEQGRFADAVRLCQEAVKADPTYSRAYVEMAGALHLMGRNREALEVLKEAVGLDPANMEFVLRHISNLREAGMMEEVLSALQWAVRVSPDPMIRLALAECYLEIGRYKEAREECRRVLRERPREIYALDLLQNSYIREGAPEQALRIACRLVELCPQDPM
ncbi:MAG: tetratricopeptide repeat protein, partial [Armatimonadota bacterium]|nr:tetratricopeptide repeat protein [Armatimonadota bacterium]